MKIPRMKNTKLQKLEDTLTQPACTMWLALSLTQKQKETADPYKEFETKGNLQDKFPKDTENKNT